MTRLAPEFPVNETRAPRHERAYERRRSYMEPRMYAPQPRSGLLIAGLLVLGAGALAWYYLGPDFRRYMKIRAM